MITVGIREIKNRLSEYLRRAKAGERIIVTERGKPVAVITKPGRVVGERIEAKAGKPRGSRKAPKIKGPSVADAVIQDRG